MFEGRYSYLSSFYSTDLRVDLRAYIKPSCAYRNYYTVCNVVYCL